MILFRKPTSVAGRIALVACLFSFLFLPGSATAQMRFTYSKGQTVSPAFEGWEPNKDGSFTLYFGYMNPNWEQEFDVPIGPDNHFEPGGRTKVNRRTFIRAGIRSCSRFKCRRILATRNWSGRS